MALHTTACSGSSRSSSPDLPLSCAFFPFGGMLEGGCVVLRKKGSKVGGWGCRMGRAVGSGVFCYDIQKSFHTHSPPPLSHKPKTGDHHAKPAPRVPSGLGSFSGKALRVSRCNRAHEYRTSSCAAFWPGCGGLDRRGAASTAKCLLRRHLRPETCPLSHVDKHQTPPDVRILYKARRLWRRRRYISLLGRSRLATVALHAAEQHTALVLDKDKVLLSYSSVALEQNNMSNCFSSK